MQIEEYTIENLNCASCAAKIVDSISALPEVKSANLDFVSKKLLVQYSSISSKALIRLNQVAESVEPGTKILDISSPTTNKAFETRWPMIGLGLSIFIVASVFETHLQTPLFLAAYVLCGFRVALSAIRKLFKARVFDEHFLMTIATIGAVYLNQYMEAILVMVLYEIGQHLEGLSVNKSRKSLKNILAIQTEYAHIITDDGIIDHKLSLVSIGDIIRIMPGERIPLDGIVTKGESSLDGSSLTGESDPIFASRDTLVYGGFINGGGLLEVKVQKTEADSTVSRIMMLIENAGKRKSQTEQFITKFAKVYTPIVVMMALLLFVIPVAFGASISVWLPRALIFLIVSCPCALVISIPLTYYIGIGIAAKKGIIFKGSIYLDNLRRVKTLVFDKTGTLTDGNLSIAEVLSSPDTDEETLKAVLFICESNSNHPLAAAIKKTWNYDVDPRLITHSNELPGKGIEMIYANDRLVCGTSDYLGSIGIITLDPHNDQTLIHVAKNGQYLGYVGFVDQIKPGIEQAVKFLRKFGVKHFSMLSGDRLSKAQHIARIIGLDSYYANLLPENKIEKLETLMQDQLPMTAYVGDGLNDAPALIRSDIGIAMGEIGNQASIENADVVLLNDKAEQLTNAFQISRKTHLIASQNIAIALGIKVLVMILGAFGLSSLWEAVIADVGVTLIAIVNAMRLARTR